MRKQLLTPTRCQRTYKKINFDRDSPDKVAIPNKLDIASIEKALAIPGMVEPIEMQSLFKYANAQHIMDGEQVVEFGSFFGAARTALQRV